MEPYQILMGPYYTLIACTVKAFGCPMYVICSGIKFLEQDWYKQKQIVERTSVPSIFVKCSSGLAGGDPLFVYFNSTKVVIQYFMQTSKCYMQRPSASREKCHIATCFNHCDVIDKPYHLVTIKASVVRLLHYIAERIRMKDKRNPDVHLVLHAAQQVSCYKQINWECVNHLLLKNAPFY